MNSEDPLNAAEEPCTQAELYALEALAPPERMAFERHLTACARCAAETRALSAVVADLGLAAPAVAPPAGLRQRLLAELAREGAGAGTQVWKSWRPMPAAGAAHVVRAADSPWEATAIAGIEVRRLHADPANDRVTMLVRMAAGTAYPPHRHGGPEECFVLEGELQVGEELRSDYQQMAAGEVHPLQSTATGCLLLISSSMRDELLEARA
jgi:putative transcriptional regulator